jgi:hypothetical protein
MTEYDFTLKFDVSGINTNPSDIADLLYGAGCDDAIIGFGKDGVIAVNFTRDALSASDAINSAISDVNQCVPDARLIEAIPDFVGITEIAEIIKCSRQNVRGLYIRKSNNFPPPIHDGNQVIWHLAKVLPWFREKQNYSIPDNLIDISIKNMKLNIERQLQDSY